MRFKRFQFLLAVIVLALIVGTAVLILRLQTSRQGSESTTIASNRAKILVNQEGFYRLRPSDLGEAGLSIKAFNPDDVHLSLSGLEVPYTIQDGDLIFYSREPDSRYASSRAYLFEIGRPGRIMEEIPLPKNAGPIVERIPQRLHLEQNLIYDGRTMGEVTLLDQEPWYWLTIQPQSTTPIDFSLPTSNEEPAVIRMKMWGATDNPAIENDHDLDVIVNDQTVGILQWDGENHYVGEITLPPGVLVTGTNKLVLDNSVEGASPIDIMRLDWVEIVFDAPAIAVDERLKIENISGLVELKGFQGQPLLFDLSDQDDPKIITGWDDSNGKFAMTSDRILYATGPGGLLKPEIIKPFRASDLRDQTNQADLLIITTDELSPALKPLVEKRESQGLTVKLISVEEIYDEFGYGQEGPDSIVAFVRFAFENWAQPNPKYLFIVGEATYDYQDYLGQKPKNIVPSPMIPVQFSGETVSDTRLADVDQDQLPELAIGRWPVGDARSVQSLVERTLAYESGQIAGEAIFAADGSSPEFTNLNDQIIDNSDFTISPITRLDGIGVDEFTKAWNKGAWLVTYSGHGSLDRWGKDTIFQNEAVTGLRSTGSPPIMVQLTCLTGFFAHPTVTSLSETMLQYENGPVLVVAATSLTLSSSQQPFAINLLRALQDPSVARIGDAVQQAKLDLEVNNEVGLQEIVDTFGLLGDPSALIVRPLPTSS